MKGRQTNKNPGYLGLLSVTGVGMNQSGGLYWATLGVTVSSCHKSPVHHQCSKEHKSVQAKWLWYSDIKSRIDGCSTLMASLFCEFDIFGIALLYSAPSPLGLLVRGNDDHWGKSWNLGDLSIHFACLDTHTHTNKHDSVTQFCVHIVANMNDRIWAQPINWYNICVSISANLTTWRHSFDIF